jgi:lysophospholipase
MQLVNIAENPLPPHAVVGMLRAGRVGIRTAHWPATRQTARGTVVLCLGRAEFIEKYAEVVGDLLARGFAVVAFDWRGQGGSSRLLDNRRKGHVGHFDQYQADLETIRTKVLEPYCPKPWFALAHSMGGEIAIEHAAGGRCMFDRIVLSTPMIEIYGLSTPRAAQALAATATLLGLGRFYVPGGNNRSLMAQPFEGNVLTSDVRRYATFAALTRAAPELTIGAPTYGWLNAAFRAMTKIHRQDFIRRIETPMLVVACGSDRVVETRAIERFATRLKVGCLIVVPHARHEVLMEQDQFRSQFWAAFDSFIPGTAVPL